MQGTVSFFIIHEVNHQRQWRRRELRLTKRILNPDDVNVHASTPIWRKPDRFKKPHTIPHHRNTVGSIHATYAPSPRICSGDSTRQSMPRPTQKPRTKDTKPAETPTWLLQDKCIERCFCQQSIYKIRKRTQYTPEQLSEATRQATRKALPTLNIPKRSQGPNSIGRGKGHNVWQRVNDPSQVVNRSTRRDPLGGSERGTLGELDSMGSP